MRVVIKREVISCSIMLCVLMAFSTCDHRDIKLSLDTVEVVMQTQPDSALTILHRAVDYFTQKKDYQRLGLSYFYLGKIYEQMDSVILSAQTYVKAQELLPNVNDHNVSGLVTNKVALLYQNQRDYKHALILFRQSLSAFQRAENIKKEGTTLSQIARLFYLEGKHIDSMLCYLNKAQVIATEQNDLDLLHWILTTKVAALQEQKDFEQAGRIFSDAIQEYKQGVVPITNYPLLSMLYLNSMQIDSARHYMQLTLSAPLATAKQRTGALAGLRKIEEQAGNKQKAKEYDSLYNMLSDSIQKELYNRDVRVITEKTNVEKLKSEHFKFTKRHVGITIAIAVFALVCVMCIIFLTKRRLVSQKHQYFVALYQQKKQAKEVVRKSLSESWNYKLFVEKFSSEKIDMTNKKSSAKIIVIANLAYPCLTEWLKKHYPKLNNGDIALSFLLLTGYAQKEIAFFYGISYNTLYTRSSRLYNKFGIKTNPKDVLSFRKQLLELYIQSAM